MRGTLTLNCEASPDKYFSESPAVITAAKAECQNCPVQDECAELGQNEAYGVWGGMTPEERTKARHFREILFEELVNSRIRRMQKGGASISAMARELGLPRKTLADRLRRLTELAA
ncbi:WhiB family transcriptional regulator [Streptomyces sp. NPDC006872]|uniref:WhiB family transcriptional regulator n=1 Tax=Streptomyces sp. NPDC006872 TaxID=3155720 RepID=UPI0033CD5B88